jgi:hypothetical protein
MPGMPDLTVIESGNPHENAGLDRNVVFTAGVETSRNLECPTP